MAGRFIPPSDSAVSGSHPGQSNEATQLPTTQGMNVVEDTICDTGSGASVYFKACAGHTGHDVASAAKGGCLGASGRTHTMAVSLTNYGSNNSNCKDLFSDCADL